MISGPVPQPRTDSSSWVSAWIDGVWVEFGPFLNKHGAGLAVDGDFGGVTDTAVKNFQGVNQLVKDGEAGPITWEALLS